MVAAYSLGNETEVALRKELDRKDPLGSYILDLIHLLVLEKTGDIVQKIAEEKAVGKNDVPCTYFGDGEWDKKACEELGYSFVLVGERTYHSQSILDFKDAKQALAYIGL